jgi:hypothetical protein
VINQEAIVTQLLGIGQCLFNFRDNLLGRWSIVLQDGSELKEKVCRRICGRYQALLDRCILFLDRRADFLARIPELSHVGDSCPHVDGVTAAELPPEYDLLVSPGERGTIHCGHCGHDISVVINLKMPDNPTRTINDDLARVLQEALGTKEELAPPVEEQVQAEPPTFTESGNVTTYDTPGQPAASLIEKVGYKDILSAAQTVAGVGNLLPGASQIGEAAQQIGTEGIPGVGDLLRLLFMQAKNLGVSTTQSVGKEIGENLVRLLGGNQGA